MESDDGELSGNELSGNERYVPPDSARDLDPSSPFDHSSPQRRRGRRVLGLILAASVLLGAAGAVRSAFIGDDTPGPCYVIKASGSVADARQPCDRVPRAEEFADFEVIFEDPNVAVETISDINMSVQTECRKRLPTLEPRVVTDELQVRVNLSDSGLRFTHRCFAIVRE